MALFTIFLFVFETKLEILKYLSILYQKYYLNTNFSMKITNVLFDKSISIDSDKVYFDNKKQIVFVWRSNVGKSSLMNSIFEKKDLVKTSSLPGKTKTANLFTVNNKFHFVDLPGYWFAKLWKEHQKKLDDLISWYLEEFKHDIKRLVVVLDSKLGPTQIDIDMFKFIQEFEIPLTFVLNKTDKLSNNEVFKSLKHTQDIFFGQKVFTVSAKKGDWVWELLKFLGESLK